MLPLSPLMFLVLVTAPALAAEQPCKAPPWHLVDIWWNTGEDRSFESYRIDVTISEDVPSSVRLHIAPIGIAGAFSGSD